MSVSDEKKQEYLDLLSNILDNADAADEDFQKVNDVVTAPCEINQVINYNPNMTIVYNNDGKPLGYDYKYTGPVSPNPDALDIDSNNDSGTFGYATGGGGSTRGGGAGRGRHGTTLGATRYVGDVTANQVQNTGLVSGFIDTAWAAVSALSKLGKNVGSIAADAIQATGAAFGDAFDGLLTRSTEAGANAVRVLFGVDSNGSTNMYMDEDTLGAMAIQLRDDGYFSFGESKYIPDDAAIQQFGEAYNRDFYSNARIEHGTYIVNGIEYTGYLYTSMSVDYGFNFARGGPCKHGYVFAEPLIEGSYVQIPIGPPNYQTLIAVDFSRYSTPPSMMCFGWFGISDNVCYHGNVGNAYSGDPRTYNGKTVNYAAGYGEATVRNPTISNDTTGLVIGILAWVILYGSTYSPGTSIPGISDQPDATSMVDAVTGADPHVVAQNLYTQYPQVMGEPILINVLDDSCNVVTNRYYSIPISYSPTNVTINAPTTGTTQESPSFNPNISIDPTINIDRLIDQIILQLQGSGAGHDVVQVIDDPDSGESSGIQTLPAEVPNTGSGVTPESALPQTDVTGMWHVYNPSSAEVSALGSWLWTSSIIEQIVRMFNDPTNSIIGLHAIYGEPHVSSSPSPIVVGNLSSTVSSLVVTSQYTQVDCGEVLLTEYFGNVFDYAPYTDISLFLPFIGIVPLEVADVMRSRIQVVYNVDVYTGACIAQVSVTRDGVGGVLYQYAGSCAISYPVSSLSYNNIFASMVSISMGVAALAAGVTGPAGARMVAGAIGGAATGGIGHISRSGAFSGNAGALGSKKPYLIIRRPQTNMALNFELYDGYGSNFTTYLSKCKGFTKCKVVHLNIPGAYKAELDELTQLLHEGIILPNS